MRPVISGPPFTGHYRVMADTPKGLTPFSPAASVPKSEPISTSSAASPLAANLSLRKNIYDSSKEEKAAKIEKTMTCHTCSVDCTKVRYHCIKKPTINICPPCYLEGRFPSNFQSAEFIKLTADESSDEGGLEVSAWTDEEVLLLLEGLEMYDDDWIKISEHVGSRTRDECVMHFLSLPIEDKVVEGTFVQHAVGTGNPVISEITPKNLAFSQADNPVMSVVAFLASAVNPGLAATAAKTALKEITAQRESIFQGGSTTKEAIKEANGAVEGSSDLTPKQRLEQVAATALASSAVKAKTLAEIEERRVQRFVGILVETQLKKLELKMNHFEELERYLENEKKEIEKQRQELFNARLNIRRQWMALNNNNNNNDGDMGSSSAEFGRAGQMQLVRDQPSVASDENHMTSLN